jgi:hypothetical protein
MDYRLDVGPRMKRLSFPLLNHLFLTLCVALMGTAAWAEPHLVKVGVYANEPKLLSSASCSTKSPGAKAGSCNPCPANGNAAWS